MVRRGDRLQDDPVDGHGILLNDFNSHLILGATRHFLRLMVWSCSFTQSHNKKKLMSCREKHHY